MGKSMSKGAKTIKVGGKTKIVQSGSNAEKKYLSQGATVLSGSTAQQANTERRQELKNLNKPGGKVLGVSTTTISNANKMNAIPGMVKELNTYSNKGTMTDELGNERYADGSFVEPEPEPIKPTKKTQEEDPYDTSVEDRQIEKQLSTMRKSVDAQTKSAIDNISQKFAIRKQQQERINAQANKQMQNALLTGGVTGQGSSAQYAPISSVGTMQAQESYGLQQLAVLDAQEQDLIFEAKAAQQEQNYRLMEEKLLMIKEKRTEKLNTAAEISKAIAKKNEEDLAVMEQMDRESAISDMYSQGVTDTGSILSNLKKSGLKATAKEVSDTIGLLSGIGGTGEVGRYNFYAAQARAKGQVPLDYLGFIAAEKKASTAPKSTSTGGGTITPTTPSGKEALTTFTSAIDSVANMEPTVTGKAAVRSQMQELIKNGDYQGAYMQIANSVESKLTGTNKTGFADARTDYEIMGGLERAIQQYSDAGGDMNLLKGKEEQIRRKLGIGTPKESELATQLWREFQQYRLNMTGAAFSPAESKDYASVNPTIGKNLDLNLSIIKGARNQLANRVDSTINARVPKASEIRKLAENGQALGASTNLIDQEAQAEQAVTQAGLRDPKIQGEITKLSSKVIPSLGRPMTFEEIKAFLGIQ